MSACLKHLTGNRYICQFVDRSLAFRWKFLMIRSLFFSLARVYQIIMNFKIMTVSLLRCNMNNWSRTQSNTLSNTLVHFLLIACIYICFSSILYLSIRLLFKFDFHEHIKPLEEERCHSIISSSCSDKWSSPIPSHDEPHLPQQSADRSRFLVHHAAENIPFVRRPQKHPQKTEVSILSRGETDLEKKKMLGVFSSTQIQVDTDANRGQFLW